MSTTFSVKLSQKDLYRFKVYHAYTGSQGLLTILIGVIVLTIASFTMGTVQPFYTVMYYLFAVVFWIYTPIALWLQTKSQYKKMASLRETLTYTVDDTGIHVAVGEQKVDLAWSGIYKLVSTKQDVLIYSGRVNAYVIPKEQIGDSYEPLKQLAQAHLESFRVKLK